MPLSCLPSAIQLPSQQGTSISSISAWRACRSSTKTLDDEAGLNALPRASSTWLRLRIDVSAQINAGVSHFGECDRASPKGTPAAPASAAAYRLVADELLRCELPERQSLEWHQYRTNLGL